MVVYAYAPSGFEGNLVHVEVDIRRGLPAFDLTGLPDGAIKEARDRVRAAVRNSGFEFPVDRVLVNLAPAGMKKCGASFDLPIALAILAASGQLPEPGRPVLALGELLLSGETLPVCGVLSAMAAAMERDIGDAIVAPGNFREASSLHAGRVHSLASLRTALETFARVRDGIDQPDPGIVSAEQAGDGAGADPNGDFSDIRGQGPLRRALEVAAAGGHHVLLFGPPGSGKTMAASRFGSILPDLDRERSFETTKIHSLAGTLPPSRGLIVRPPFRAPHHGASAEGIVGGGRFVRPGEISLAHGGVLFLDEAPEFRIDILQSLREPIESGRISIARAETSAWFPARFQLILAANPCPCGNLGRPSAVCLCSVDDVKRYWKRLGGPLLDRIDIRVPVRNAGSSELLGPPGESSGEIRKRVRKARELQEIRYRKESFALNAHVPPGFIERYCPIEGEFRCEFLASAEKSGISSRAIHSIARLARTIADLSDDKQIGRRHVEEAFSLRKYGEENVFWRIP
ncbi:MAG: YifB family Mg chelatase-like AAA ATPase [Spirochaetes bacterium]|nr:YifB family Mg chelatase-like AAA ATPase [Spirochaetota bacterium]